MNQSTSDHRAALAASHNALRAAVLGVGETGWTLPTPCDQWNVTQVLQHAAGDQRAHAAAITGHGGPAETHSPLRASGRPG